QDRHHVWWTHGRGRVGGRHRHLRPTPVHARPAAVVSFAPRPPAHPDGDPGNASGHAEPAAGVPVPPAVPRGAGTLPFRGPRAAPAPPQPPRGLPRAPMSGRLEAAPVLEARGLTKVFTVGTGLRPQRLRALHDVSLRLGKGRITALVGESGSGKSTVAKILARLVRPTAGEIVLDGRNVVAEESRASLAYRGRVQMIFQDHFPSLNPAQTIAYHLERPLVRHGKVRGRAERRA